MTTTKLEMKLKEHGIYRKRIAAGDHIIYTNGEKTMTLPYRGGKDVNKMLIKKLEATFDIKGAFVSKKQKAKPYKGILEAMKVNYHLTSRCNFNCGHCFAKYTKEELSLQDKKEVIKKLAKAGVSEINFAGGEPMYVEGIKELFKLTRKLGMKVSVITNGSNILGRNLLKYIDTLGISIDSFCEATNIEIGRHANGEIVDYTRLIRQAKEQGVKVKVNTVVTTLNINENFKDTFEGLGIDRLKFIMVKNGGDVQVSEEDFMEFTVRNKIDTNIVIETAEALINSYIIVEPLGRFAMNSEVPGYDYTNSILDNNPEKEFIKVNFNEDKYWERYK